MPEMIAPKVLSWASELEPDTAEQAARLSRLPFVHQHLALMPDAHLGKGATVGSVIATRGAVVPAAVGVDLGCGMLAVATNLRSSDLTESRLQTILGRLVKEIPAGVCQGHAEAVKDAERHVSELVTAHDKRGRRGDPPRLDRRLQPGKDLYRLAVSQFGTLGSGNHFLEILVAENDVAWLVVHSGSRGVGNRLATGHIREASGRMDQWFVALEDPDLAYIPEKTEHFGRYIADVAWAQEYAWRNRQQMMRIALGALRRFTDQFSTPIAWAAGYETLEPHGLDFVHCHHNYMVREHHMGTDLWVTRKGAVRAREGDFSVLPGSMGTPTYIVRGLGNPASFTSAPHGAGRRLSRTAARRELDLDDMKARMAGRVWLEADAEALKDEHPLAYKDINQVLEDSADLVEIVHTLEPVLNFKGL